MGSNRVLGPFWRANSILLGGLLHPNVSPTRLMMPLLDIILEHETPQPRGRKHTQDTALYT